jgi:hypothetical protein
MITPLETLTTMFAVFSCVTYGFEWYKPKDVSAPVILSCKTRLDDDLVLSIVKNHQIMYGNNSKSKSLDAIRRRPFGAIMRYFWSDAIKKTTWVKAVRLALAFVAGVYNGAHFSVKSRIFTKDMYIMWLACCWVGVGVPFVIFCLSLFLLFVPKWPRYGNLILSLLILCYSTSRVVPFVLTFAAGLGFQGGLPIAAFYETTVADYMFYL